MLCQCQKVSHPSGIPLHCAVDLLDLHLPAHGCLCASDGIHVVITIADVLLMCVGFLPAIPNPVTDYAIARNVLMSASRCLRR